MIPSLRAALARLRLGNRPISSALRLTFRPIVRALHGTNRLIVLSGEPWTTILYCAPVILLGMGIILSSGTLMALGMLSVLLYFLALALLILWDVYGP